jgi:diguanylate cyclase
MAPVDPASGIADAPAQPRRLSDADREILGSVATRRILAPGDPARDPAHEPCMSIVEAGAVRVHVDEALPPVVVRRGEYFGEMALLVGAHAQSGTAVAIEPTTLAVVGRNAFEQLLRHESAHMCEFMRRSFAHLVAAEQALIANLKRRNEALMVTLHSLQHMQSQLSTANDLVRTDELTGLTNRRGLYQYLDARQAEPAPGSHLALLLFDLDGFKAINDRCGHQAGDEVLRVVAAEISAIAGPDDLLCRLGGDEFALLVHVLHGEELELLSARIVNAIRVLPPPGDGARLTVSVGASLCRPDADWSSWYRDADRALYRAKEAGGDGWRLLR